MNHLAIPRTHTNIAFIAIILAVMFFVGHFFVKTALAHSKNPVADHHIITLHDDTIDKGFITEAKTLREALKNENIRLDANDRTEPGLDEPLTSPSYEVNIYRARPVIVRDEGRELRIISAYRTPEQIAKHANITLQSEDVAEMVASTDIVRDGAAEIMTISRATAFTFTFYGSTSTSYTQEATVGGMLKAKKITLAATDQVEPSMDTPITDGMTVKLWRNGKQTITQDEDIAFSVEQVKDATKDSGYKDVKTPGENGKRTVTYEVDMQNGVEVSRREVNSNVTKQPVKQVEVVGSKLPTPTNPSENAQLGHQMMLAYGFGEDQWPCLYNLWMRESGWRVNAANPSGAYGIPQALPGSKMGPGWQTDAAAQIQWGLGYVKGRYSTPCGAWSAFQSKGWY